MPLPNVDIYVPGSNSKFLSKDIITEFRGEAIKSVSIHFRLRGFMRSVAKTLTMP